MTLVQILLIVLAGYIFAITSYIAVKFLGYSDSIEIIYKDWTRR